MREKTWIKRGALLALVLWLIAVLAAPAAGEAFRFAVMGDSRGDVHQKEKGPINETELSYLIKEIIDLNPKPLFVVFGGDLALRASVNDWKSWKRIMQPLANAGIGLYLVKGNHELYDAKVKCRLDNQTAYQAFVAANYAYIPSNGPPGYDRLAYSFEHDNSLFIVLDSFYMYPDSIVDADVYGGITWQQLAWLDESLATTPKTHRFVFSHMPAYPRDATKPDGSLKKYDRSLYDLWKILVARRITYFFGAHEHLYDNWYITNQVDKDWTRGIRQFIAGCAGAPFTIEKSPDPRATAEHPRQTVLKKDNFVVVDVDGDKVTWIAYGGTAKAGYTVIDQPK
jgi:hypothetical protein